MIDFYNSQVDGFTQWCEENQTTDRKANVEKFIDTDATKISWGGSLKDDLLRRKRLTFQSDALVSAMYRPFQTQYVYFDAQLNQRRYKLPTMFPTPHLTNIGFYVVGTGNDKPFFTFMTALLPDVSFWGSGQGHYFPLGPTASPNLWMALLTSTH